jgi:hypothetical protein
MQYNQNNPPADLFDKVMAAIADERARLRAIRNFIIASLFCAGTLVSSIFVWNGFVRELVSSGFGQYASLAFSDIKIVLVNWQDFSLSLLESFPALATAELVAEIVVLMVSIKFIVSYAKKMAPARRLKAASNI